jgi:hypothetical protein
MKREEQVRAALAVLRPPPRLREVYKREMERSLDSIERSVHLREAMKTPKRKIELHISALRRALRTIPYKDARFAELLTRRITLFKNQLEPPDWLEPRSRGRTARRPPKRDAYRQKIAVVEAEGLLINFDYRVPLTRGGDWHKLSAIFYGDRSADLFNHMRRCRALG